MKQNYRIGVFVFIFCWKGSFAQTHPPTCFVQNGGTNPLIHLCRSIRNVILPTHLYLICDNDHRKNDHLYGDPDSGTPSSILLEQMRDVHSGRILLEGFSSPYKGWDSQHQVAISGLENNAIKMAYFVATLRKHAGDPAYSAGYYVTNAVDILTQGFPGDFPPASKEKFIDQFWDKKADKVQNLEQLAVFLSSKLSASDRTLLDNNDEDALEARREDFMVENILDSLQNHKSVAVVVGEFHCRRIMDKIRKISPKARFVFHSGILSRPGGPSEMGTLDHFDPQSGMFVRKDRHIGQFLETKVGVWEQGRSDLREKWDDFKTFFEGTFGEIIRKLHSAGGGNGPPKTTVMVFNPETGQFEGVEGGVPALNCH